MIAIRITISSTPTLKATPGPGSWLGSGARLSQSVSAARKVLECCFPVQSRVGRVREHPREEGTLAVPSGESPGLPVVPLPAGSQVEVWAALHRCCIPGEKFSAAEGPQRHFL